jgi:cell cycle checkpoint protein
MLHYRSQFHSAFEAPTSGTPTVTRTSSVKRDAGPSKTRRTLQDGIAAPKESIKSSTKQQSQRTPTQVIPTGQVIVIDDSDVEAEVVKKRPRTSTASRKVSIEGISSDEDLLPTKGKAKQKPTAPSSNAKIEANHRDEQEVVQAMWCDAYAPTSTADLAPSKTRVQAVRSWLEEALYGRPSSVDQDIPFSQLARDRIRKYRRILVLSGPAGVGKTTTLKLIAKELNVEVVEWEEGAEEWSMGGQIGKAFWGWRFNIAWHSY